MKKNIKGMVGTKSEALSMTEKTAILEKVNKWESKQQKRNSRMVEINNLLIKQKNEDNVYIRFLELVGLRKKPQTLGSFNRSAALVEKQAKLEGDRGVARKKEESARLEKETELLKHISKKQNQILEIEKAKWNWGLIRKKRVVLKMMRYVGIEEIGKMYQEVQQMRKAQGTEIYYGQQPKITDVDETEPSKLIIKPNSVCNMIKNDVVLVFFILYAIMLPQMVSYGVALRPTDVSFLIFFDVIFIVDRILNLFVGYINKDGKAEPRIWMVVYHNLSSALIIEILVTVIPIYIGMRQINSLYFFIFKIFRYVRMMEMEIQINEIIKNFEDQMTVFELKKL
jgi:hypothetical protein